MSKKQDITLRWLNNLIVSRTVDFFSFSTFVCFLLADGVLFYFFVPNKRALIGRLGGMCNASVFFPALLHIYARCSYYTQFWYKYEAIGSYSYRVNIRVGTQIWRSGFNMAAVLDSHWGAAVNP